MLDTRRSALQRVAHVMLPTRHAAERDGTLTNCAGRVQRIWPAIEPSFEALADGEAISRLAREMGRPGFDEVYDVGSVSKALSQSSPAFAGIDLDSVGEHGQPLRAAGGSER